MAHPEFEQHQIEEEGDTEQDFISTPIVVRIDKTLVVKDRFTVNDNETQLLHGQRIYRKAVTANYTLAVMDYLVGITSLATISSIGLPNPATVSVGKIYTIKDEVGGAATTTVTVRSEGEKSIDGATSLAISTNYASYQFYTDGANWFVY